MRMSGTLTIIISLLVSLLLIIVPVAPWLSDIWPIWVIPVMVYWIMALPHRVGLVSAWICGIFLDLLNNTLLGSHALALLIIAALFSKMARRFSFFASLQQMIVLFFLTIFYLLMLNIVQLYSNQDVNSIFTFWWPAATTALIWPVVSSILRYYRQRYRIT